MTNEAEHAAIAFCQTLKILRACYNTKRGGRGEGGAAAPSETITTTTTSSSTSPSTFGRDWTDLPLLQLLDIRVRFTDFVIDTQFLNRCPSVVLCQSSRFHNRVPLRRDRALSALTPSLPRNPGPNRSASTVLPPSNPPLYQQPQGTIDRL